MLILMNANTDFDAIWNKFNQANSNINITAEKELQRSFTVLDVVLI